MVKYVKGNKSTGKLFFLALDHGIMCHCKKILLENQNPTLTPSIPTF